MKRKLPVLFLITLYALISFNNTSKAQSVELPDFDRAMKTYLQSTDKYKKEHADYILAKSQYERFGTLNSQNAAFEETLQMLDARDQVIIDYLLVLKEKVLASTGLEENEVNEAIIKLDQGVGIFADHKTRLSSAGSLEDLVADSKEAEKEYDKVIPDVYEALSLPAYGLITDYEDRLENLHTGLKAKYENIRKDEREGYKLSGNKLHLIDQWLLESQLRFARSEEKRIEARQLINDLSGKKRIRSSNYDAILKKAMESRQHLKEAVGFMNEILTKIKIAD